MKVKSLLLALGLSLVVGKSFAISFKVDGISYVANADTAIIKGYSEIPENGELTLASIVSYGGKDYRVTTVQGSAFLSCTDIKKLIVPANIKYIQSGAFENCVNMDKLVLEEGEERLNAESDAFKNCGIEEVVIGRDLKNSIFRRNIVLTKVVFGNKIKNIPYESEKKYSSVFYEENRHKYCTVKGSLEKVLSFCDSSYIDGKKAKLNEKEIISRNEELAKNGYRVIALASSQVDSIPSKEVLSDEDIPKLSFVGLVAFIDPIREETVESIRECKKAGIKVVMITGDHPLTAFAISRELGLCSSYDEVATGDYIASYLAKGNKEFEFKNLEHIKIDGVEVCDIINDVNTKFKVLCEELNSQSKKIDLLEQTIKKLAEYIDNQRFL